jgi:hypothetical protein
MRSRPATRVIVAVDAEPSEAAARAREELVARLAGNVVALLRCELELEAAERLQEIRRRAFDGALVGAAGVCLFIAGAALSWAAMIAIDTWLPQWVSALAVCGAWLGVAAGLLGWASRRNPGHGAAWRATPEERDDMIERYRLERDAADRRLRATTRLLASELLADGMHRQVRGAIELAEHEVEAIQAQTPLLSEAASVLMAPSRFGFTVVVRALGLRPGPPRR